MANEFFQAFGPDAAIAITPKANGRLEVYLDGEKIYDRKEEDNTYPDLPRVKALKAQIRQKLEAVPAAAND